MILNCEVIGVETTGDTLRIKLQGNSLADAAWRNMNVQSIEISASGKVGSTFYVGRKVAISVRPK
jgi:hypothetical protein